MRDVPFSALQFAFYGKNEFWAWEKEKYCYCIRLRGSPNVLSTMASNDQRNSR